MQVKVHRKSHQGLSASWQTNKREHFTINEILSNPYKYMTDALVQEAAIASVLVQ